MTMKRNRFNEYGQRNQGGYSYEDRYFFDLPPAENEVDEYGRQREERMRRHDRPRGMRSGRRYHPVHISLFGEHPESLGAEEYRGGNKRHPGLGLHNYRNRRLRDVPYRVNEAPRPRRNSRRRRNHLRVPHYLLRREQEDYLNRGQYEMPYQRRGTYDPYGRWDEREAFMNDEELDHLYQEDSFQNLSAPESFGRRGSMQRGAHWEDEDEYPSGHRMNRRRYGKYASR
jgi:hypothetical protein